MKKLKKLIAKLPFLKAYFLGKAAQEREKKRIKAIGEANKEKQLTGYKCLVFYSLKRDEFVVMRKVDIKQGVLQKKWGAMSVRDIENTAIYATT